MQEPLLNRTEAAKLLGITVSGLRRMDREGRGPRATRVGRLVRYQPDALRKYIEANTEREGDRRGDQA